MYSWIKDTDIYIYTILYIYIVNRHVQLPVYRVPQFGPSHQRETSFVISLQHLPPAVIQNPSKPINWLIISPPPEKEMKVDSKDSIIPRGINNYNQLHIFQTTNYLGWSGDPVYEMQGCLVDFWSKIYRNRLIDVIACGGCHLTYIKHVLFTHIYIYTHAQYTFSPPRKHLKSYSKGPKVTPIKIQVPLAIILV